MPRKYYLFAALFWTSLILYFSLKDANDIPRITIPYFDKFVHFCFHFGFTFLWYLYFHFSFTKINGFKISIFCFMASLIFGVTIEFLQHFYTNTRSADILDVLSNSLGALSAVLFIGSISKSTNFLDKI